MKYIQLTGYLLSSDYYKWYDGEMTKDLFLIFIKPKQSFTRLSSVCPVWLLLLVLSADGMTKAFNLASNASTIKKQSLLLK